MMGQNLRIGVDVGGTFTDLVLHDSARKKSYYGKLLTTPDDPSEAILNGIGRILEENHYPISAVHSIVHGTTLVTNTIIERTGAKVGLITTRGFRDSIEIGKETRYDLYDLFLERIEPLVARSFRKVVSERVSADGEILLALAVEEVEAVAKELVEQKGVEAIAISFMNAYRQSVHEKKAVEVVRRLYPHIPVSASSDVAPEIHEYERGVTACANAYVQPLMGKYLDKLSQTLKANGFLGQLYVMLSGGGLTTIEDAKKYPIRLIESGPAAGALSSAHFAALTGMDHVISFDMGGTTAKMCLIEHGKPVHKFSFEAGRVRRFQKGSGLPLKISVIEMIEIGAGGGSLAHVDAASGLMKVGPRSAGSKPGPVCYGLGGENPTVTDADLLLGRLDPAYFLGGELKLDMQRMSEAFMTRVGERLHITAEQAASGTQRIVDETMAAATRMHFAEKGKDPRRYTMIAFGGAGPVHAWNLAKLLKIKTLVVPPGAGVASAFGFLVAPPATDRVRSYVSRLERTDWHHVNTLFAEMAEQGKALLVQAGVAQQDIVYNPSVEMRYVGQGFEISVPLPSLTLSSEDLPRIGQAFAEHYRTLFHRTLDNCPVESLSWRLMCSGPSPKMEMEQEQKEGAGGADQGLKGHRKVFFSDAGWLDCPVYERTRLSIGVVFDGPAVIEERESTCIVGPDSKIEIDAHKNLRVTIGGDA